MVDEETKNILKEILKLLKIITYEDVKNKFDQAFISKDKEIDSEKKKLIYHLSDGVTSSIDISKMVGTSDSTVRVQWQNFALLGLMNPIDKGRGIRYEKSFNLEEFHIEIPEIK